MSDVHQALAAIERAMTWPQDDDSLSGYSGVVIEGLAALAVVRAIIEELLDFLSDVDDARSDRPDYYDEAMRIGSRFEKHEAGLRRDAA